ncbi:MAG: phosphonate ABC transporter substrate-binding protein [Alcaligenaceae bacterium]
MLRKLLALAIVSIAPLVYTQGSQAQELNFGLISTESSQNLKQNWLPLFADLERQTGIKAKPFFASDYAGIIEGMRFKKVQAAWLGNKAAMEAVDRSGAEVFAQQVAASGSLGYYSHLVVHRDSALSSVEDVLKNAKSLSFGNGDPNSTSGFLVPGFYVFAKNNVDPKKIFKVTRAANHETNLLTVAIKQVDVATANSEALERLQVVQPEKFKEIKVIWTSPLIAADPILMLKDLPEATKQKLKDFFYGYGKTDAKEKEILMNIGKLAGFQASTNAQLIPIRELDLFSQRLKVENDEAMSVADKQAKLAELDSKMAVLKK